MNWVHCQTRLHLVFLWWSLMFIIVFTPHWMTHHSSLCSDKLIHPFDLISKLHKDIKNYRFIDQREPFVHIFFICKLLDSLEHLTHVIEIFLVKFFYLFLIQLPFDLLVHQTNFLFNLNLQPLYLFCSGIIACWVYLWFYVGYCRNDSPQLLLQLRLLILYLFNGALVRIVRLIKPFTTVV